MQTRLVPVIEVDQDKCVNCHACITVCPVKFCNDGSKNHVSVNADLCIACGSCIDACTHDARKYLDDLDAFFHDLDQGVPMVAVVAPSAASNFRDQYLRLNGFLKKIGIKAVFDVSFGAELTIKSYLEYAGKHNPKTIISQPCPAIVTYIELYQPELIPYLAPADSPVIHTIKMVREFYHDYQGHKFVFIAPCAAKRREFDELKLGDYTVTIKTLNSYLQAHKISLADYPEVEFDNPPAERAVLFSTPGGLLRTALRDHPDLINVTRKIEGPSVVYGYLKKLPEMIDKGFAPFLIDCLNCEMGCNGGPGTLNRDESPDLIEYYVEKRNREVQQQYGTGNPVRKYQGRHRLNRVLDRFFDENKPEESLKKVLTIYIDFIAENDTYFRMMTILMSQGNLNLDSSKALVEVMNESLIRIDRIFRLMKFTDNPRPLSRYIYATMIGISVSYNKLPGINPESRIKHMQSLAEILYDMIIHYPRDSKLPG